ncbi:hypothetical protein D3C81_2090180 [compost metagenome]
MVPLLFSTQFTPDAPYFRRRQATADKPQHALEQQHGRELAGRATVGQLLEQTAAAVQDTAQLSRGGQADQQRAQQGGRT